MRRPLNAILVASGAVLALLAPAPSLVGAVSAHPPDRTPEVATSHSAGATTGVATRSRARYIPTGWPSKKNTGASGDPATRGAITITQDGATLKNVRVKGQVTVRADNVTISNVYVDTDHFYGIVTYGKNTRILHTTVTGDPPTTMAGVAALSGGTFVAKRIKVRRAEDGVRLSSDCVLKHSLIHRLQGSSSSHFDSVTADGSTGWRIVHNSILNQHALTAAVWVGDPRYGPSAGLLKRNYIAGGGYSIYGGPGAGDGIRVVDNVFSTRFYAKSGYYGVVIKWDPRGNTWQGNTWIDGPRKGRSITP